MNPRNVHPRNFTNVRVIYTSPDGFFSIAVGEGDGGNEYETTSRRFAMRWNGHTEAQLGYPTSNGHPMWFQLPDDIGDVIKALYDNSSLVTTNQNGNQQQDMHARRE